ncbi:MAG TPA: 3-hydroxyacyl-[acyl-carrier-protein] dehydratase FabZ, partial [Planctomycetes bacterium]|nr:3-hydroxyacyl-[acyl-carrier-protein] dehydratase FabZ [Planctomycetota bacterium]
MRLQKTIASEARLAGKGLFAGREAKVVFRPAEIDTGVVFVRSDLAEPVRILASIANIAKRDRRSALKKGSVSID